MRTDEEVKIILEKKLRAVLEEIKDKKRLFEDQDGNNSRKEEIVGKLDTSKGGSRRFNQEIIYVKENTQCFNELNQAKEKFKTLTGIEYPSVIKNNIENTDSYITKAIENQSKLTREFEEKAQASIDKVSIAQTQVKDLKTELAFYKPGVDEPEPNKFNP